MGRIRVVVADDSAFSRELIGAILASDADLDVAGEASNGREAVRMVAELRPDIVTMDIGMPVMDGLQAIEHIMSTTPVPILVVTGRGDSETAFRALSLGALEVVPKADVNLESAFDFVQKIKILSRVRVITHLRRKGRAQEPSAPAAQADALRSIVAIASSTGGPKALSVILPRLPADFPCPVVVAQHIQGDFVHGLVQWLRGLTSMDVTVAADGSPLGPGTVYVAPAERHMEVAPGGVVRLLDRGPGDIYHPSCDRLLSSVAAVYGDSALGVILTGMGSDGAEGMVRIKRNGGATIAQDADTSAIFGMPKVAIETGCIDKVLPLDKIADGIMGLARLRAEAGGKA